MSTVTMDPNTYKLKPLEVIRRLIDAPDFMDSSSADAFTSYMVKNTIRPSASNGSISAEATVKISQAHMGVSLFRQQRETSRLLAGLVYKIMVPDHTVPTGTRFLKQYKVTDQREAQRGTWDTVGNGVKTREYSQVFQHTSKVLTMSFGSLLGITVPSVAAELIRREFERVGTSWELTRTIEVLQYCTAQPTLTDRIAQRLGRYSRAERLNSVLVMAELTCGMVNVHPDAFVCILENARRVLGGDRDEVLVMGDTLFKVISQSSGSGIRTRIVSEVATLVPEVEVYSASNEKPRGDGTYEFTMEQVAKGALGSGASLFTEESSFRDKSIEMVVNYVHLGGGRTSNIPIARVDSVQMEHGCGRDTSTEYKAFCNTQGFKWEYFTVGCTAPALNQVVASNVLSSVETDEINYKHLAQRSPSVSYLHSYDGSVAGVTLRELHKHGNPKEFFGRGRREKLQAELNKLARNGFREMTVERMCTLARTSDWYAKLKNPTSVLEFDARNMVMPVPPEAPAGHEAAQRAEAVAPARWLVRPRVALFNSSSMNNIDSEIAQIGSELLTLFGETEEAEAVHKNVTLLNIAMQNALGVQSALQMRRAILAGQAVPCLDAQEWAKGRRFWSWMADPICAVYMRRRLSVKENQDAGVLSDTECAVLCELEGLINGVLALFKRVVGNRRNSVIASMPSCFEHTPSNELSDYGYPTTFTLDEVDYCNLMYWIILPSLGARVYGVQQAGARSVRAQLRYRDEDRDLLEELDIANADGRPSVARLRGDCVFSKVRPDNTEDVSEHFEPTALRHASCRDTGFDGTSVVTYMWAIRLQKLSEISNTLAKVLLGLHYSTLLTHDVMQNHYDTTYYSGMSYLLFRGVRFTGCGVALMQQKSALYALGTGVTCKPTAHNTHQVQTVNQYCESVVIPETLESPGLYIPDLYMKDVRGGEVHVDRRGGPYAMVIADAFNGFCPESDSASGYRRPYLFTTGRSQALQGLGGTLAADPLMDCDAYTCMPTLLRPFSSALGGGQCGRRRNNEDESNHDLFCDTLHVQEFEKSVLDSIGDPFQDTVERANGNKRSTDIMQPSLGVAFCGTYSIGKTSDKKLMCHSNVMNAESLAERLAPRISGTGVFACNPMPTTSNLIAPVFTRIFDTSRYDRTLRI